MNLSHMIETLDTGHFARREYILEDLRTKAREMGFFPLPLSQKDIECFWIRLEPNESNVGKKIHFQKEHVDDEIFLNIIKEVARYETR